MTVEISTDTEIEILPPARPSAPEALGALAAHVEAMTNAKKLGDALSGSELVPVTYRGKPDNAAAAILYGAELGLNPIQSLQNIFVVHGTPAIYARTMVALVKRHGYLIETAHSSDDSVTVNGTGPGGRFETSTWNIERATKAGYVPTRLDNGEWKKNGNGKLDGNMKYITDPQAMLYAKAAAEVCRKLAPDVLLGIPQLHEELEPDPQPVRVRAERADRGIKGLRAVTVDAQSDTAVPESPASGQDSAPSAPTAEPTPEAPEVLMVTKAQLTKLHILLGECDISTGEDGHAVGLAWLSAEVARPLESSKELTRQEASMVIQVLEHEKTQRAQKSENPTTTTEGK